MSTHGYDYAITLGRVIADDSLGELDCTNCETLRILDTGNGVASTLCRTHAYRCRCGSCDACRWVFEPEQELRYESYDNESEYIHPVAKFDMYMEYAYGITLHEGHWFVGYVGFTKHNANEAEWFCTKCNKFEYITPDMEGMLKGIAHSATHDKNRTSDFWNAAIHHGTSKPIVDDIDMSSLPAKDAEHWAKVLPELHNNPMMRRTGETRKELWRDAWNRQMWGCNKCPIMRELW